MSKIGALQRQIRDWQAEQIHHFLEAERLGECIVQAEEEIEYLQNQEEKEQP